MTAAYGVLALGVLGGFGALFPTSFLGRPFATFPSATLGGALGNISLGLALLGRSTGRRWLLLIGGLAAVCIGVVPLLTRAVSSGPSAPAMMRLSPPMLQDLPATTGLFLLLGGLGLLALAVRRRRRLAHIFAGVCGSTVLLVSITVIVGRLTGFLDGTEGSLLMGASLYALAVGGINGAALMRLAAGYQAPTSQVASWLPNVIGVSAAVTVIFIWLALVDRDEEQMQQQIDLASVLAASNVRGELLGLSNGIKRIALRAALRTPAVDEALVGQMQLLTDDETQSIRAVAWPRALPVGNREPIVVVPANPRYAVILTDVIERETKAPAPTKGDTLHPVDYFNVSAPEMFSIGVRVCAGTSCRAPFGVLFDARTAFGNLLADSLTGFYLAVRLDAQRVVRSGLSGQTDPKWLRSTNIDLSSGGARWQITVWPTPATLARARSDLPEGVLVLGLALAMLLPVTLRLAETAWSAAARTERARVNAALESATDSLWVWDIENDTTERGAALWSHLGYPPPKGAVPLSAWLALVHPKDRDSVRQAMSRHLAANTESMDLEYRVRDADDNWHWLVERGRVVERSEKGTPLRALGVTADITERKNADAALAASERKYRATFDSASQLKALLDDAGRVVEMNPAGRRLAGLHGGGIVGVPIWEFSAFRGSEAMREALVAACESGYAGKGTAVVVQLDPEEVDSRTWDVSVTPIESGDGTVTQLLVNARDITDRKRAEQALRELGNLATMGRLTALVAHEINNPLAGIHSAFSLIKSAVPATHPHYKYVGAIEREIARIAQVTQQLYETYRHEPEASRRASVETVVSDAVAFIEQVNRRSPVRIVVDLSVAPSIVPFPDALIRRVVYNLVQNAVDASPEDGTVYLTASHADGVFTLTVRDEGAGIPPEMRGRIFDPFVSTKGPGIRTGGMGLGLALVHGSVTAFGGTVSVQDASGGGSVFVVRLPLTYTIDGVPHNGTRAHSAR